MVIKRWGCDCVVVIVVKILVGIVILSVLGVLIVMWLVCMVFLIVVCILDGFVLLDIFMMWIWLWGIVMVVLIVIFVDEVGILIIWDMLVFMIVFIIEWLILLVEILVLIVVCVIGFINMGVLIVWVLGKCWKMLGKVKICVGNYEIGIEYNDKMYYIGFIFWFCFKEKKIVERLFYCVS